MSTFYRRQWEILKDKRKSWEKNSWSKDKNSGNRRGESSFITFRDFIREIEMGEIALKEEGGCGKKIRRGRAL